jgi:hypothetical protein
MVCVAVPILGSPAGATRQAHSAKFVGGYTLRVIQSGTVNKSHLVVNADGSCKTTSQGGTPLACTWSNTRAQFTLVANSVEVTLDGKRTTKGIASRRNPGTAYNNGTPYATWFAVKTS